MKLKLSGVDIYVDKEKQIMRIVQQGKEIIEKSGKEKTKLVEEFDWLNNEFLCTYEVE